MTEDEEPRSPSLKKILLWVVGVVVGVPAALIGGLLLWINLADRTNGTLVSSGASP